MTSTSGTTTQAVLLRPLAPETLASALAALQTRLPKIGKASTAQYGNYADLADVSKDLLPVMGELGLSFSAKPTWVTRDNGDREFVLVYKLRHVSGESDEGEYPLVAADKAVNHQQLGGAITYGRRYALCAITGAVADDDDDGAAAAEAGPVAKRQRGKAPERAAGNLPRNRDGSTSRSKTTDEELAATGQMTDAELRDHNRLEREVKGTGPQGAERLTVVPDDDPWYQPEPLPIPTAAQPKAGVIQMHMKRLLRPEETGAETPEQKNERLSFLSAIVGRPVRSTNDLSAIEGIQADKFLRTVKNKTALKEKLALGAGEAVDA